MAMKEDIVEYDDCSVPAVYLLQLGGDVMDKILQFLRCDLQQLRGDVIDWFADVDGSLPSALGPSLP